MVRGDAHPLANIYRDRLSFEEIQTVVAFWEWGMLRKITPYPPMMRGGLMGNWYEMLPTEKSIFTNMRCSPGSRSDRHYLALLEKFPPRPISSEEQLEATQEMIDSLISRPQLTPDEQDYLNVLGSLVREYEELYHSLPALRGVELIKALLAELNLDIEALVFIFKSKDRATDVLNNKCDLTVTEVQNLAEFFLVSPTAFLGQN